MATRWGLLPIFGAGVDLPTAPPPPAPAHHGAHGGVGFPWCWGGMGGMAGVRDQRVPGMGSETQRARLHQAARGNPGPGVGLDPKRQSAGLGVGVSQAGAAPRPTQGHAVQDPRCAGPATLGLCPQDLAWHRAWSPHWDSHRWGGGVPKLSRSPHSSGFSTAAGAGGVLG